MIGELELEFICVFVTVRISQKLEYACRVLVQLAKHHDGLSITRLDALAQREEVSPNFLVQILNDLRRSNIVDSKRGKAGGYVLARNPNEITLYEIVEVLEPALLANSVGGSGESGASVQQAWAKASKAFNNHLQNVTLATITIEETQMFYI